jgi:glutamyl-tRNA synthetase
VNKGAASFDAKKLSAFQERQMLALPVADKFELALPYLQRIGLQPDHETLTRVVTEAGPRLVVGGDILEYDFFFLPDDRLPYDEKAVEKFLRKPPGPALLPKLRLILETANPFDSATLKRMVEELATTENVKPGPISQMLRVATTGKEVGFGTYETLAILGRTRCLARIDIATARV